MTDQTPDLAALEALAEAAITPDDADTGVWEIKRRKTQFGILRNFGVDRFGDMWHAYVIYDAGDENDAAFIAAANPATVLWLIREVKRLRGGANG